MQTNAPAAKRELKTEKLATDPGCSVPSVPCSPERRTMTMCPLASSAQIKRRS